VSDLSLEFTKSFSADEDVEFFNLHVAADGNVFVNGRTHDGNDADLLLVKYDSTGTVLTSKAIGGHFDTGVIEESPLGDGSIIVSSSCDEFATCMVRVDSALSSIIFQREYGYVAGTSMTRGDGNDMIYSGPKLGGNGEMQSAVISLASDGTEQFTKYLSGHDFYWLKEMFKTRDGRYMHLGEALEGDSTGTTGLSMMMFDSELSGCNGSFVDFTPEKVNTSWTLVDVAGGTASDVDGALTLPNNASDPLVVMSYTDATNIICFAQSADALTTSGDGDDDDNDTVAVVLVTVMLAALCVTLWGTCVFMRKQQTKKITASKPKQNAMEMGRISK
jgi:hypothetical protein